MILNKKIVLLMACLSLFLCIITLQDTYAKYTSSTTGTTDISIARWRILVNDFDIRNNVTTNSLITPVFNGTENIASNIIAPTSIGYFDVIIDATETDVSFSYTINVDVNEDSAVYDLAATGYQIDDGALTPVTNGDDITGNIYLTNVTRTTTVRIYVRWNDDVTATMSNRDDTNATLDNLAAAKLDVGINFTQIA